MFVMGQNSRDVEYSTVSCLGGLTVNRVGPLMVNDLPLEILALIFTAGITVQTDGGRFGTTVQEEEGKLQFQVLVSHVCRHWRQVVTQMPLLWTHLTFSEPHPFEKSQVWIKRSKRCPLIIELNVKETLWDVPEITLDDGWGGDELQYSVVKCIVQILDIVLPHVCRWKHFKAVVRDFAVMHQMLKCLAVCAGAPLLETLQLIAYDDSDTYDTFEPRSLRDPVAPFQGTIPRLREVSLWGMPIAWDLVANITSLNLEFHAMDIRPSFEEFTTMMQRSPQIDTLKLCCSGPALPMDGTDAWPPEPIPLPSLRNLALAFDRPEYVTQLVRSIYPPALRFLALCFDDSDYTEFVKQLCAPMVVSSGSYASMSETKPQCLLFSIEHIALTGLPCEESVIDDFYRALPNLRAIDLNLNNLQWKFFSSLSYAHEILSVGNKTVVTRYPFTPILCPRLETLTTIGITGEAMSTWIKHRARGGYPIARLNMSDKDKVLEAERRYLEEHVHDFAFFPDDEDYSLEGVFADSGFSDDGNEIDDDSDEDVE